MYISSFLKTKACIDICMKLDSGSGAWARKDEIDSDSDSSLQTMRDYPEGIDIHSYGDLRMFACGHA